MSETIRQPGLLLVVSSPSGAGKTTLCRRLQGEFPQIVFSVSYTTRPMRAGERDGVDYQFVDDVAFADMVARGEFAEWAAVHDRRYGTTVRAVQRALDEGRDVLFDVDYQGGRQLKARFGPLAVMVFVLPPSWSELERRLRGRATDAPEMIDRRLAKAREELEHYALYDYLLVNDDLEQAYQGLRAIYFAAAHRIERRYERAEALIRASRLPSSR
jgi:guanylate kinase